VNDANWEAAAVITDTLPGGQSTFTALLPYSSGTIYIALRSQNADGDRSAVSNNVFWPHFDVFLPLIRR
jgi:hypothetical protein